MPPPTITITSPSTGGTVPRTFTVTGTYSPEPPPSITVVLKDATGATVATGTIVSIGGGNWSAQIIAPQSYNGASVQASFPGANDSAGNITVQ